MGLAASEGVIVYSEQIRGDTKTHLIDDLRDAGELAGWGSQAITGGFKFTLLSKQDLSCKLKIWDDGDSNQIKLQFLSFDESRQGYRHKLRTGGGRIYLAHVNRCQLFAARLGVELFDGVEAVQGGIPFVPELTNQCSVSLAGFQPAEAWWSCGDTDPGTDPQNFRRSHLSGAAWSACYNADLMNTESNTTGGYAEMARLQIAGVNLAVNVGFFGGPVQLTQFSNGRPLYLDPLILWGSGHAHNSVARHRGQLYDAMMPSLDRPLDYKETICGADWTNYMHGPTHNQTGTKFGCLYLLTGITPTPATRGPYVY
jgi:hypothetical protein